MRIRRNKSGSYEAVGGDQAYVEKLKENEIIVVIGLSFLPDRADRATEGGSVASSGGICEMNTDEEAVRGAHTVKA